MPKVWRVLNLGAGTQSSGVYLMMLAGELEPADVAVFADTQWEPPQVYDTVKWLHEVGGDRIPVVTVSKGNIYEDALRSMVRGGASGGENRFASMPLHVKHADGSGGIIRRQCTREYKIEPIEKYIREELFGLKPRQWWPKEHRCTNVFGISMDEMQRIKPPRRPCLQHEYPLVEMRLRRQDVINWLADRYPERHFVRSACSGCPFRTHREWDWVRHNDPVGWQQAVALDEKIRNADGMRGEVYMHSSKLPLTIAPRGDDPNQLDLFNEECEGMCGL